MRFSRFCGFGLAVALSSFMAPSTFGQATAIPPYQLSIFATAPSGLSAPDSIAVLGNHVYVGYGDGHDPAGLDGLSSQVVEYDMSGNLLRIFTVKGHNDGLKVDPLTNRLWAVQNEDANPNLVIIDPKTNHQKLFTFSATPHGGGYDDLVFRGCQVFFSASNPANNPNTEPAIVSARLKGDVVEVEGVLAGTANATDLVSGATNPLNLQDPDSMTLDPQGNIVLDSQGDQELIIVSDPGTPNQNVLRLPLSFINAGTQTGVEVDDTAFITSTQGFILFADKNLNTVFKLGKDAFAPGAAYTAADGGPFVGTLDLTTGIISPIVTGLGDPGGLVFVDTSKHERDSERAGQDACRDDRGGDRE